MKALALVSGGLDSTLAAKLIKDQGIEVTALNFKIPFSLCEKETTNGCRNGAVKAANDLGIELKIINISDDFFKILKSPKYGYGSNMNPCIDCRILLFKKAKEIMLKEGASFVVSGEVLGQRPMSQKLKSMRLIERESGLEGLLLRPLSAKILEPTIPEKQGWIAREKLLDINGRMRRRQFALAKEFGIQDYPCPGGGCLLTDSGFSRRLKDLMEFQQLNLGDIQLLKLGRHFRLSDKAKLVVGRNERENQRLLNLAKEDDYLFMPQDTVGPTALGRGQFNEELIRLSSSITCRYCDLNGKVRADITCKRVPKKEEKIFKIYPIEDTKLIDFRI